MIVRTQTVRFSPDRTPMPKRVKIGYESDNMVERLMFVLPEIAGAQTATMMRGGAYANAVTLVRDEGGSYYCDLTAEIVVRMAMWKPMCRWTAQAARYGTAA